MAIPLAPEHKRATAVFLVAVAGALQILAVALAMPERLFLCVLGLGGPLLLGVLALRVQAKRSWKVVAFLAELLLLVAAVAAACAVLSPSSALGPLMLLWTSWLAVLPVFLRLRRLESRSPGYSE